MMVTEMEAKLRRLGIVNLRISSRHDECVVVARGRGGQTVVARGDSPDRVVGRVIAVLELRAASTP
jgi:hypothetical protein